MHIYAQERISMFFRTHALALLDQLATLATLANSTAHRARQYQIWQSLFCVLIFEPYPLSTALPYPISQNR